MATWKKIIVSGSNAELNRLNVGLNQQISSSASDTFLSGSFNGNLTGTADTASFVTGSNVYGPHGSNSVLSASFAVTASYVLGGSSTPGTLSEGTGISDFSFDGSVNTTVAVSGAASLSTDVITKWTGTAFANSSLTDNGTTITGASSIQLTGNNSILTGSFTGSFKGDGSQLTGVASTLNVSGSTGNGSVDLQTQTLSIVGTANEVETSAAGQTITVGLPNDVIIGNNLTVTGDLTVNGTTTTINTTNLLVEDKFILVASGSTTNTDGGLIVQNNAAGSGFAYFLDSVTTPRWGFATGVAHNTTDATPDEYAVSAKSTGSVWTAASDAPTYGGTNQGYGNIMIDTNSDIWIYV
jgi:hypothetical protein